MVPTLICVRSARSPPAGRRYRFAEAISQDQGAYDMAGRRSAEWNPQAEPVARDLGHLTNKQWVRLDDQHVIVAESLARD